MPEVLDLALYYLRNMHHRISGFTPLSYIIMEAAQSRLQDAHVKAREKSDQVKLRVLSVGDLVL